MKKDKKIKEKELQKAILDYLRWFGIFCWKANNVGIFVKAKNQYIPSGMKGISDILGIFNRRFLAIEVKGTDGVVSKWQKEFIDKVNQYGGIAFVARSLDDVREKLFNENNAD